MSHCPDDPHDPFAGAGEVRALARAKDWAETPLGPVDTWSQTLRTTVRTVLDSPFPINLWCGPELVLVYNDAYAPVLGIKHPGALGRSGREVWGEIWDEIAPMFERIRQGGPPVYAQDAPFVVERAPSAPLTEDPGGPNAWFTFSLSGVRDEKGCVVAFLNVVSETTDRLLAERERERVRARAARAEARLREVFAHAPSFMAVLRGPDHVFEYANEAYRDLVGPRELVGRAVAEALPEVRAQGFESLLDRVYATGEPFVGREVPVRLARGGEAQEERWVDFVYYPITDADGSKTGVVAHGSDVTEHVRDRREAERARAEAEHASRAKSRFLATMSHELRTPINAIIGYTQLLEMGIIGPVTERQKAQLGRVRGSSEHLLMLIDDILDLAKVEAGRIDVVREPVDLAATVHDAVGLVAPQAEERGVGLEILCGPGEEPAGSGLGDEPRVRQILVNVLSNAVKFTPSGGRIRVRCGAEEDEARIEVIDTGIGIPPEQQERIFEAFIQGDAGPLNAKEGTGLGLSISRQLARLMGGDLTVESEVGAGSTFTLTLPAVGSP